MRGLTAMLGLVMAAGPGPLGAQTVHQWQPGAGNIALEPTATHVCYVSAVTGKFIGPNAIRVVVKESSPAQWTLLGGDDRSEPSGAATCVPLARISHSPEAAVWQSGVFWAHAGSPNVCGQQSINAWQGDAATMITGVWGSMRGGGEFVQVVQAGDPFAASQLKVNSCQSGSGEAHSLFVGVPQSGYLPKFVGPGGAGVAATAAGEYVAGPNASVAMALDSEGFCYLTAVGGAFNGGGEAVEVRQQDTAAGLRWFLTTRSLSGTGTGGRARCLAYDQGG